jgi:hypothetical protein
MFAGITWRNISGAFTLLLYLSVFYIPQQKVTADHAYLLCLDCKPFLASLVPHREHSLHQLVSLDQLFLWPQILPQKGHCVFHYEDESHKCAYTLV